MKSIPPLLRFVILSVRKRASVFGSPFAPGFGVNGQSLRVGPKDLLLEILIKLDTNPN